MANVADESSVLLLRAYLDAVTLSESLRTRLWHDAELTLVQVRVLRRLAKRPQTLGQLAAELSLAPPSMTRLVDRLEDRGLIARHRNDNDRRKVVAALTEKGHIIVGVVPLLEGTAIRTAVDRMSVADRERIGKAFSEFNAAVREVEDGVVAVAP